MKLPKAAKMDAPESVPPIEEAHIPPKSSKLLDLPPELRNRIYEYCLKAEHLRGSGMVVEPNSSCVEWSIWVNRVTNYRINYHDPPGLLATCRQLREETSKIFYLSNPFWLTIWDYDATRLCAWEKLCRMIDRRLGARPETVIKVYHDANWENLKQWCYFLWAGKVPFVEEDEEEVDEDSEGNNHIFMFVQNLAQQHQGRPWKECEKLLEAFRKVAGDIDEDWLETESDSDESDDSD